MLKVGITGMMGSGKSYISSLFAKLGVPVYNSDARARWLINNHPLLKKEIEIEFGEVFLKGKIITEKIRTLVFTENKEHNLNKLNSIVHPYVFQDFNLFCHNNSNFPFILAESAILFEAKMETFLDKIIFVSVPYQIRLERAQKRDNISKEEYDIRMRPQIQEEVKINKSDFVIDNSLEVDKSSEVHHIYSSLLNQ